MKKILPLLLIMICVLTLKIQAQSAVYFCKTTGKYGYCYGAATEMAARECAYTNCIKAGGSRPESIAYSEGKGFAAICIAEDYEGNVVIGVAVGQPTRDEADSYATHQAEIHGGYYHQKIRERWEDK